MRRHHYEFNKDIPEEIRLKEGCAVVLKDGSRVYVDSIPEEKRPFVDFVSIRVSDITITDVKRLMKKYGGYGYTEHIDRDGGVFEVTEIQETGNNSRFKYNRHL